MLSGYLLRNRYRIENRLAAGGFGETYIAVDEDYPNKRRVVVKHLKPQSNDPAVLETARRLFESEAVTLAQLGEKTDRIPTLYAYFEENREFYLVQELIEGKTLTLELGTQKLSEAATLEIIREILAVLTEVHTNRIVHRDLKPDNIIRRSSDRKLVLIDFGAVKAVLQTVLHASGPKSIGIGTAGYMPTEQAMGYPTAASDIYAVGAIALQCLTGKLPSQLFDEDTMELRWQHLCSVSDRVANILSRMVATKQLDRYPNAMAAIQAIDSLVAPAPPTPSVTIIAPPASIPEPPKQPHQTQSSPPATTASPQAFQPPVRQQIDRRKFVKWATLGGSGFIGILVLSKVFNRLKLSPFASTSAKRTAADKYITSGLKKFDKRDFQGALADYNRAIKIDRKHEIAYFNRGNTKDYLGNTKGALADYNKAIALAPKFADAYANRAFVKYKLGDSKGSLADSNTTIALDPKNETAFQNAAFVKYDFNDLQGAIELWSKSLKINPDNSDSQLGLAVALYKQGQESEAYQWGAAAIRQEKRSKDLNFLRNERYWSDTILKDAAKFLKTPTMTSIRPNSDSPSKQKY
ncbi:serine/threonine-protein kinase [Chamaesiphon polymorphus]|uniref:non-specific serine/threonine protein kinase n=1 Tax=Chamaesiphon polymorphus CCALA 037 TaxID=2107692 RepID=A0A2T1GMX8_9CYAN|nr:serine/threonine-protein kinase [Chamaesiphon polymorphus]PSB59271.1 hypothetical protein C7B77_01500 [Chamaesiphon polymorphus CCALA 037]